MYNINKYRRIVLFLWFEYKEIKWFYSFKKKWNVMSEEIVYWFKDFMVYIYMYILCNGCIWFVFMYFINNYKICIVFNEWMLFIVIMVCTDFIYIYFVYN